MIALFIIAIVLTLLLFFPLVVVFFLTHRSTVRRIFELERQVEALKKAVSKFSVSSERPPATEPAGEPVRMPDIPRATTPPAVQSRIDVTPEHVKPAIPLPALPRAESMPPGQARPARPRSLETVIGGRWLLYVGTLSIVVGVSYFIKYAIDNQWLTESARVILGAIFGIVLVVGGRRFSHAGYRTYGEALSGGGIAILYLSIYAAFGFYHLVGRPAAFALMAGVTAAATWMADGWRSLSLAIIAIVGGFSTPFLLQAGRDPQIVLFTYEAILVTAVILLARRRGWLQLNALSFGFFVLTFLDWGSRFFTDSKYLATQLFLTLFGGLYLWALRETRRSTHALAPLTASLLWWSPVFYHIASLYVLFNHPIALLIYILAFNLAAVIIASESRLSWLRMTAWVATAVPLMTWLRPGVPRWPLVFVLTAIFLIHLAAQIELVARRRQQWNLGEAVLFHANPAGLFAALHFVLAPIYPRSMGLLGSIFALAYLALARFLRVLDPFPSLLSIGVAIGFVAVAIALQADGPWVTIGWTTEAIVLVWVGLLAKFRLMRIAGLVLLTIAGGRVLALHFDLPADEVEAIWNQRVATGAYLVAALYAGAWLYRRFGGGPAEGTGTTIAVLTIAANVLTLMLISAELDAYWDARSLSTITAPLMKQLSLSVSWTIYAIILIIVGLRRRYAPVRYLAICVFAATIIKVFAVDLSTLDRFYRIISVIVLGSVLLVTAFLYQRYQNRIETEGTDAAKI